MAKAKRMRRARAAQKANPKPAQAGAGPERGALAGPQENPRQQGELESVEDPLQDWPEAAGAGEDSWLVERQGADEEKPGDG